MKKLVLVILSVLLLLYPVGVYFGLQYFNARVIGALLLSILLIRILLLKNQLSMARVKPLLPLAIAGVLVAIVIIVFNDPLVVKFHPVVISFASLVIFARTLIYPPSMIETFARMGEPDLPESGVVYTRKVTMVWCGFFVLNLSIAFYTAVWASMDVWLLYNGLISYLLMGLLFEGEYIVRLRTLKRAVV